MRKFLLNATLFLAILYVINFLLYFVGKRLYFGNYSSHSLKYRSYLLSDSHGEALANIGEHYGVYNFSAGSDSYLDMYRKVYYLIKKNAVDTIYISADGYMLSPYREMKNNLDRSIVYTQPEQYSSYYHYFKSKYIEHNIALLQPKVAAVIKIYITSKLETLTTKSDNISINKDWQSMTSAERIDKAELRAKQQFQYSNRSQTLENSLLDIIKLCKENNIVLIGVKFPVTPELLNVVKGKDFGAANVMDVNGISVLDFTNIYAKDTNQFVDQDHLNPTGAKNFTELLFNSKIKP